MRATLKPRRAIRLTHNAPLSENRGVLTPELKQFRDLRCSDFQRHPVWVGVHNLDVGKPWYDASDESTFRPNTEQLPLAAEGGNVHVRAHFIIRDGSRYPGLIRAASPKWDIPLRKGMPTERSLSRDSPRSIVGVQQPHICGIRRHSIFGEGLRGSRRRHASALFRRGEARGSDIPITFAAEPGLATGLTDGEVEGFYTMVFGQAPLLEL
jgi:hypothetical protein